MSDPNQTEQTLYIAEWDLRPGDLVTKDTGRYVFFGVLPAVMSRRGLVWWSVGQRQYVVEFQYLGDHFVEGVNAIETGKRFEWLQFALGVEP